MQSTSGKKDLEITPETKIAHLLELFPELEERLIALAPPFAKLRNPVLRRTIGRVATLRQAAQIGGVPLPRMINELRCAAGLEATDTKSEEKTDREAPPEWVKRARVVQTLDARPLIDAGEHPIQLVLQGLRKLKRNEAFQLITPFLPAPLLDLARQQGIESWTRRDEEEVFTTWFIREEG
jgi:uncharacterized protein (DUF2249 family)